MIALRLVREAASVPKHIELRVDLETSHHWGWVVSEGLALDGRVDFGQLIFNKARRCTCFASHRHLRSTSLAVIRYVAMAGWRCGRRIANPWDRCGTRW